jgi:hypothetical protein
LTTTAGTLYYYCTVYSQGGCPVTSAVSGAVVINAPPVISSQSTATQTKCQNVAAAAMSVTATGAAGYQWYSNTSALNSGGTLLSGATASSYTPLTTTAGTLYYYCIVSGTSPCAAVTSAVSGAIIVNAQPAAVTVSTPAPIVQAHHLAQQVVRPEQFTGKIQHQEEQALF